MSTTLDHSVALTAAVTDFEVATRNRKTVPTDVLDDMDIIRDTPHQLKVGRFNFAGLGRVDPSDLVITRQGRLYPTKVLDYVDLICSGGTIDPVDVTDIVPGGGVWHLNGLHRLVASRLLDVPVDATFWV